MAGRKTKNADLVRHVTKTPKGVYKYQRRVPLALQDQLKRAVWDYSLGPDPTAAAQRGLDLAATHDRIIATMTAPETATDAAQFIDTLQAFSDLLAKVQNWNEDAWEHVRGLMKEARTLPANAEADHLKIIAATIFGEKVPPLSDPMGIGPIRMDRQSAVLKPDDATDAAMFNTTKQAVLARLEEVAPVSAEPSPLRLSALLETYLKARAVRPNTQASYRVKAGRFIAFAGDRPLPDYTAAKLKEYRDHMATDLNPTSIRDFFAPLKALWRWAGQEHEEMAGLQFPAILMPKDPESVEDKQWKPYNDDEAKQVGKLINAAFGPDRKNRRLSDHRAAALLMVPRVVAHTGMRPVEVLHLTAADIQDGIIHIRHTKTGNQRKIPLAAPLSDLPDFLASGGFDKALINTSPAVFARNTAAAFVEVIRAGGLNNPRHVLYSLKHTLVERLQRQNVGDDVIRSIIGHVGGQGALRNYKTALGDTAHGIARMREALDSITYW